MDKHTLGQLWRALIRQERGPSGDKRKWLVPLALYGLGGCYLVFAGQSRLDRGGKAKVVPYHQLRIQGHLSLADQKEKDSLRFYVNLPEVPLDLFFSGSQINWSGDGNFVLETQIMVPQLPSHLALEVDGPGLTARSLKNLPFQAEEGGVLLRCSVPELSLRRNSAPPPKVSQPRLQLPRSVYTHVVVRESAQSHPDGPGAR